MKAPPESLRARIHRLWAALWPSFAPEARYHPDGGPEPHSGPYPWETVSGPTTPADLIEVWRDHTPPPDPQNATSPHPRHVAEPATGLTLAPGDPGYWEQFG